MTTEKGNKLIAEFMGFIRNDRPIPAGGWKHWHIKPFGYFEDEQLEYHSSWDWLRPVVDKIHNECSFYSEGLSFFDGLTIWSTKEQVYNSVVKFIIWLNQQKQKG